MTHHLNHGRVVWRYNELYDQFSSPDILAKLSRFSAMFIQPLVHLVYWIVYLCFPGTYAYFGGAYEDVTQMKMLFYIFSSAQVLVACILRWSETIEFYTLGTTLMVWKILTMGLRIPRLEIHSNSQKDHMFQYSAGALLLHNLCNVTTKHTLERLHKLGPLLNLGTK
jgi:hypothetical protein